jgi:hypothetical protein
VEGEVFFISSSNEIILQGGLACVVGRQFNQNAISHITGKSESIEKGDIGKWGMLWCWHFNLICGLIEQIIRKK